MRFTAAAFVCFCAVLCLFVGSLSAAAVVFSSDGLLLLTS